MATRTTSLIAINNTDANFRAWINEIHTAITTFGWLQTSDTGQINFATALHPGQNVYAGFAIYQMNDSLQSSCAVFMRIDFGGGNAVDTPSVKVQVTIGGTNGSGTLTGNASAQQVLASDAPGVATFANCRTSGNSSSFRLAFWLNELGSSNSQGFFFLVERDRNTSGIETSLGVSFVTFAIVGGSARSRTQFLETAGGTGAVDTIMYAMVSAASSQGGGGNVGVGPVRTQLGPFRNPLLGLLICEKTDFTMLATTPVTIYGSSHTYLLYGPQGSTNVALNSIQANCAFAILWE